MAEPVKGVRASVVVGCTLCACGLAGLPAAFGAETLTLGTALSQALRTNPNTLLRQQQVMAAEGQVLQARGSFDTVIGASVGRGRTVRPLRVDEMNALQAAGIDVGSTQNEQTTSYRLGADKTLLNGVGVGVGFNVTSTADNLNAAAGIPPQLAGSVSFNLRVPMARNAGREVAGAELDATQVEVEAFRADLHHGNAVLVLDTTFAYWDWRAKARRLEIVRDGEKRLGELIAEMQRLIDAGQLPRADIELALASRAERSAQRLAAEQAAQESRRILARLLGLAPDRAQDIGLPMDDFPPYQAFAAPLNASALVQGALGTRADLEASRHREQAARHRLTASRNNLKPQVDLSLSLGYVGLAEGAPSWRLDRGLERTAGPAVGAAMTVQWPWENNSARGLQRVASAVYDAASIRVRDVQDSIGINVPVALAALSRAAAQGAEGLEAVRRYEVTVRNERTKRRLGNATVIDVINVEDRLNNALLTDVALRQSYANAVAQLRFELGSLIRREGDDYRVPLAPLLSGAALAE